MNVTRHLGNVVPPAVSQTLALTVASAQFANAIGGTSATIVVTTPSYIAAGVNPTAPTDGSGRYLPANFTFRLDGLKTTDKVAVVALTGVGSAFITPETT